MTQLVLGRTGIRSPKNGFGALPIQRRTEEDAVRLLQKAYANGITYFDTARFYTDSEHKIGAALSAVREHITIATKTMATKVEDFWRDLETSLSELQTEYIDVYQFHNPPFCPQPNDGTGLYEAMLEAKAQGKIHHIGITNHRLSVAFEAVESGLYEILQFPFCYLASEEDERLVHLCAERNVGFVCMKGLSGGLLTDARAAYAYIDQFPNALPIWGIQKEEELAEFLSFHEAPPRMEGEILARIEKDRKELLGSFCRACGYCLPCPAGINIPQCARMSQLIRRSPSGVLLNEENQKMMEQITACISCGACASRCPYHLSPPELMKENLADYRRILSGETKLPFFCKD